ncbi:MAG TPA: ATP-dependent Clp protease ATP-binding subunit ClpX [Polyangia bacterium]
MKSSARIIDRSDAPLLTPREIYDYLDRFVVGQERAKRVIAIAAYNHLKRVGQRAARGRKSALKKANILMIGPTGCGKTHLARNLADCLKVPFSVVDATEYTEAGYYGKDVEVMAAELLFKANQDLEAAQRGIIFVDEVDKIARRSHGARTGAGSRDIGGEGVQQALLKMLEGREVFVPLNVTQHWNKHDFVLMDTQDILFICAGTFSDIHMYGAEKAIGFGTDGRSGERRHVTTKELLEYGMIAEFLGRLPVVVELDALGEDDLLKILTVPPDSLVREYQELLAVDEVRLRFTDGALREIVRYSIRRRAGARGLRGILEEVCHDLMFEAPERRGDSLAVDADYVAARLGRLDGLVLGEAE